MAATVTAPATPTVDSTMSVGIIAGSVAVSGKNSTEVWAVMDELMETLQVAKPRVYESMMRKLERL